MQLVVKKMAMFSTGGHIDQEQQQPTPQTPLIQAPCFQQCNTKEII